MKYLLTMVLAIMFSVPALAQRQHSKGVHSKANIERHVGEKSCPKCIALKKEVVGLRKRLEAATKGRPGAKGKRGGRSIRGRSPRSGGKRGASRRSNTRRFPPTKKAKDSKEMKDVRKKWEGILKKRLNGTRIESRKIGWRKFAQSHK